MCIDPENAHDGKHSIILRLMRIFVMMIMDLFDPDQIWSEDQFVHTAGKSWLTSEWKPGLIIMIGIKRLGLGSEVWSYFSTEGNFNDPGCNHTSKIISGWQMLRDRRTGGPRKVRVFYERKDPQHTLFCRSEFSFVAIYSLFERLSQSFQRKPSCFCRAFNESHPDPAFVELSTKAILFS